MLDTSIKYKYKDVSLIKADWIIESSQYFLEKLLSKDMWYELTKTLVEKEFYINKNNMFINIFTINNRSGMFLTWVHENWIMPANPQLELNFGGR